MGKQVDVSIAMMTYYHEKYVSRAIESVLAQKTCYTYEIVISDDCSQDGTRDILQSYAEKYPEIIKLNFNKKNLGISNNNYQTRLLCSGRYIATLSGDDYWIDENKLQEQVRFLDTHSEYYAVATCIEGRFDDDDKAFAIYPAEKYRNATIDIEQYLHGAMFGTNGMMMRNAYLTEEGRKFFSLVPKASAFIDDATETILVLMKGKVYVSGISSVVYRVQRDNTGKHNFNALYTTLQKCRKTIDLYNNLYTELKPCPDLFWLYFDPIAICFAQSVRLCRFREFREVYRSIPKEYRKRMIFVRAMPRMCELCVTQIKKIVLAKVKK